MPFPMIRTTLLSLTLLFGFQFESDGMDDTISFDKALPIGTWGELQAQYIRIGPPIDYVPELRTIPRGINWRFPGWDAVRMRQFIEDSPLPEEQKQSFINRVREDPEIQGLIIKPSEEEVLNLSSAARRWIYNELASYRVNRMHEKAFRYAGTSIDDWMYGIELSSSTRTLLEKLVYRNGNLMFMADTALLMKHIDSREEQREVFRALTREKTMLVKLRISDQSNIKKLSDYWGRGARAKNVYPVLESLKNRPGDRTIDIIHLLPPFARQHLFMYPDVYAMKGADLGKLDCHWSTYNFFNQGSPGPPLKTIEVKHYFENNFVAIQAADLRFGDVILYVEKSGKLLHSAVFIAADIVFTKNGSNFNSPWMFMNLDTMSKYYGRNLDLDIRCLRPKELR
ncbi:MAG: hypothetical protein HKP10_08715 [Kiritimatiellales bacterium]|nr:hypothetical protein [Kiritimatiellales bacterium]